MARRPRCEGASIVTVRVQFSVVGNVDHYLGPSLDMEQVPRLDEQVELPGLDPTLTWVRTVVWYPQGDADDESNDGQPFVYIILGNRRP